MRWILLFISVAAGGQVQELSSQARNLPPEFAADALLRLVEHAKAPAEWKQEQIEHAFHQAAAATRKIKRTPLPVHGQQRSLESYVSELNLDAMSLQTRAVRAMLTINPGQARVLFDTIHLPGELRLTCEDASVPDLSSYYRALLEVAEKSFSPQEVKRELQVQLLETSLRGIRSPVQVGPAAGVVRRSSLAMGQFQRVALALSGALAEMPADDRSFSLAMSRDTIFENLEGVVAALAGRGIPAEPLAQAFRKFITTHLEGTRCSDNVEDPRLAASLREAFNARFSPPAPSIEPEEAVPASVEMVQAGKPAPAGDPLLAALKRLRGGSRGAPEWAEEAQRFMDELQSRDDGGSDLEAFHRTAALWHGLIEILPPGDQRERALRRAAALIAGSAVRTEDAPAWYWHVKILASKFRGVDSVGGDLASAGGGLLAFYALLDQIAPEDNSDCRPGTLCTALRDADALRSELLSFLLN